MLITVFFHMVVRDKIAKNRIHKLLRNDNVKINKPEEIQDEILRFYKDFLGTSPPVLQAMDKGIVIRGKKLSSEQAC